MNVQHEGAAFTSCMNVRDEQEHENEHKNEEKNKKERTKINMNTNTVKGTGTDIDTDAEVDMDMDTNMFRFISLRFFRFVSFSDTGDNASVRENIAGC
jgi:hypothetical protein